jgi:hypothetical protein
VTNIYRYVYFLFRGRKFIEIHKRHKNESNVHYLARKRPINRIKICSFQSHIHESLFSAITPLTKDAFWLRFYDISQQND